MIQQSKIDIFYDFRADYGKNNFITISIRAMQYFELVFPKNITLSESTTRQIIFLCFIAKGLLILRHTDSWKDHI